MNISRITLEGRYYDGVNPLAHPATLTISGSEIVLSGKDVTNTYMTNELRASPRVGRADRFITLPDGLQFHCADQPHLDRLPQEIRSEGPVAWLEARIAVAVASVFLIVVSLLFGYFYGLPAAAESVVKRIPIETEKALGDEIIAWLDDYKWFNAPHIDQEHQDAIQDGFKRLYAGLSMEKHYRLVFRCSKFIGPNAFALPGGTIVITDQMVKAAGSDEEILAVLAHEIGHVERRHTMRQVLQSSAVGIAVATITADAASLSVAVAGLPTILAQTKYSREFEKEADTFAFALLRERSISPDAFASLMERLDNDSDEIKHLSFISTHPVTSERIEAAREASVEIE
jgi:predicted Zn-dependent protease